MVRKLAVLGAVMMMGALGVAAPASGGLEVRLATPLVFVSPAPGTATTSPGTFTLTIIGCNILNLGSGGPVKIAVGLAKGEEFVAEPQVFDAPLGTVLAQTFNVPAGLVASPPPYTLEAVCYRENGNGIGPDTDGTGDDPDGTDFTEPLAPDALQANGGVRAQAVGDDILGVGSLAVSIRAASVTPTPAPAPSAVPTDLLGDFGPATPVSGTPRFTG